jgi:hypothetical protein
MDENRKHSCNYCGKDFSRKSNMIRHVRGVHSIDIVSPKQAAQAASNDAIMYRMFKICWKQMQSDELKAHVETTHTTKHVNIYM